MPHAPKTRSTARRTRPEASRTKPSTTQIAASAPSQRTVPGSSLRQLAHELNSLLDGSMRCVGMVRSSLPQADGGAYASIDDGLGKAHAAMKHMAALLERAMRQTVSEAPASAESMTEIFHSEGTVQAMVSTLEGLLAPHARAANAALRFSVASDCAALPAAALGPVLMNGVRNALQACEVRDDASPAQVRITILREDRSLCIAIVGPAVTKPEGHRIGLSLSMQIVGELGGELSFTSAAGLTTLRVCVPVAKLRS